PVLLHAAGHVHAQDLERVAEKRRAHAAGAARSAHAQRLHHDAITRREPAVARRLRDLAEGLMADDAALGHALVQVSLEDVEIRAADPHPLHLEDCLILARLRFGGRARPEMSRALVERGPHLTGPPGSCAWRLPRV